MSWSKHATVGGAHSSNSQQHHMQLRLVGRKLPLPAIHFIAIMKQQACNKVSAHMKLSCFVMFWLPCNVSCSQLSTEHWPPTKQQSMVNIDIVIIMWLTCVSFWLLDLHRTLKVTACTHTVTKATHKRPCNFCKLNDLNFMKPLIHFKVNGQSTAII